MPASSKGGRKPRASSGSSPHRAKGGGGAKARGGVCKATKPKSKGRGGKGGGNRRWRSARCGVCVACNATDCGDCRNCVDMPKFGGTGHRKQACVRRVCTMPRVMDPSEAMLLAPEVAVAMLNSRHADAGEAPPPFVLAC